MDSDEDYADIFRSIFNAENTTTATRALLSIADFGIKLGGSALGARIYFGTKGNWNTILTSKSDDNYTGIFHRLITQYIETKASTVQEKLKEIIDENIKLLGRTMWRYHFVKYPRMLGNFHMIYAFMDRKENNVKIQRMEGSTLNGYHIAPYYREIALQLGNETCDLDRCRGINSEEGAVVLKCGVSVELKYDGGWSINVKNVKDEMEYVVDDLIEKFNGKDTDEMDYVERGVILCTMLNNALQKDK